MPPARMPSDSSFWACGIGASMRPRSSSACTSAVTSRAVPTRRLAADSLSGTSMALTCRWRTVPSGRTTRVRSICLSPAAIARSMTAAPNPGPRDNERQGHGGIDLRRIGGVEIEAEQADELVGPRPPPRLQVVLEASDHRGLLGEPQRPLASAAKAGRAAFHSHRMTMARGSASEFQSCPVASGASHSGRSRGIASSAVKNHRTLKPPTRWTTSSGTQGPTRQSAVEAAPPPSTIRTRFGFPAPPPDWGGCRKTRWRSAHSGP